MSNKLTQLNQKNLFQEALQPANSQSSPFESIHNQNQHQNTQQHNLKPIHTFLKPNHLNSSTQTIKHMLMDRFKQKKQIMLQSTSIYIDTGEIKRKHGIREKSQIISQIKNTSLQKLPFINQEQAKYHAHRLSQTIESYSELNKSFSSQVTCSPSSSTLESSTNLGRAKMHLLKRKSLNEANELSSNYAIDNDSRQKRSNGQSPKSRTIFTGFDQEIRKKYLKSIVDRYFPKDQSPERQMQVDNKRQSKDMKKLAKYRNLNNKSTIVSRDKQFKQRKLPSLNSSQMQTSNDTRQLRSQSINEGLYSQGLNNTQAQFEAPQFETINDHIINSNSSAFSLSQSYLLEKIQQDQQQSQGFKGQDFYNTSRLYNSSTDLQLTNLAHQSSSSVIMNSSSQNLFNLAKSSHSSLQQSPKPKSQTIKIYENRSFSIFKLKHASFQNISQNHNLKTLSVSYEFRKYFLNEPSMELKKRQMRAKEIILSQCGPCFGEMWEEDIFDKSCIKLNITKNSPPCHGRVLPLTLSRMLYKISPQMQSGSSSFLLVKPTFTEKPTPFVTQQSLLSNSHSDLISLLLNISLPFSKFSGSLINNKLSLNNIFYRDYNSYAVNEWAYSYFRQDFLIQDKQFEKRNEPILKNQFGEWFVTPEYLAPEVLENLCFSKEQVVKYWVKRQGKKMQKSIVQEHDLFQYGNKADVWSLGLMVLEIITLIPVWIGQKCIVQNKTNPSIRPRRGFLYTEKRNPLKTLTKQSYLKENLNKIIRIESEPYQIQEWLLKLLHRMLDLDAQKRISFAQIVQELQGRLKK